MSDCLFDLEAWLTRIGYSGSRTPSLETLEALISAQTQAVPFENVEVFLGHVPRLDLGSLQAKMVGRKRGGYCFEQNLLFRAGLVALGFNVTSLMARVILGLDGGAARPATHMVLWVDLPGGAFIADVGLGRQTPTAPLAVRPDVEQRTPHDVMRLLRAGEELVLQASLGDEWQNLYRLSREPKLDIDYEVATARLSAT
jgi:N-hydroxyarylamine O-acetyltransferase